MLAANRLLVKAKKIALPISAVTVSISNSTIIEGQSSSLAGYVIGGVPPYKYEFYANGSIYLGGVTTSNTSYAMWYTGNSAHSSLTCKVTDSIGSVKTSVAIGITILYNYAGAPTLYWPNQNDIAYLYANPVWNPVGTCTWYWSNVVYGTPFQAFTTGLSATTGVVQPGEIYDYYYQTQNTAGYSYSSVVRVQR